jgi:hypothetical protein
VLRKYLPCWISPEFRFSSLVSIEREEEAAGGAIHPWDRNS